jgi:hypothetical protein
MKQIKITLEATVEVPDHVELGEDHNGIPYYMTMIEPGTYKLEFQNGALTAPTHLILTVKCYLYPLGLRK